MRASRAEGHGLLAGVRDLFAPSRASSQEQCAGTQNSVLEEGRLKQKMDIVRFHLAVCLYLGLLKGQRLLRERLLGVRKRAKQPR